MTERDSESAMPGFMARFGRLRVTRVAITPAIVGWLVIEVAATATATALSSAPLAK